MRQGGQAVFAADAGLLVAAHRHFRRRFTPGVDPADAGFQLVDDPVRASQVAGHHAGRQAVVGVVGAADHFLFAVVDQDAHHRAEDLFANDGHLIRAVGEYGRGDIGTLGVRALGHALAADQQACTFRAALVDIAEHAVHMGEAG